MWHKARKIMESFGLVRRPAAEPFMEPVNEISWAIPDDDYLISTMELVHQGLISRQEADQLIRCHYYQKRLRKAQETIAEGVHINPQPLVRWADLQVCPYSFFNRAEERIKDGIVDFGEISRKTEDWLIRWRR